MKIFLFNVLPGWIGGFSLAVIYFYGWKIRKAQNKNRKLLAELKELPDFEYEWQVKEWETKMEYVKGRIDTIDEMF